MTIVTPSPAPTSPVISRTGLAASIVLIVLSALWFYKERSFESGVTLASAIIAFLAVVTEGLKQHADFRRYDNVGMFFMFILGAAGLGFFGRDLFFTPVASNPQPRQIVIDPTAQYFVRVYNCDDICEVYIGDNEVPVVEARYSEDTGWIEVTRFLQTRETSVDVRVSNSGGTVTYAFQIRKNDEIDPIEDVKCGTWDSFGCNNNQEYPRGVVKTLSYVFVRP